VIGAAPTPEQEPEQSHFLSATGDLLTRLGSTVYDLGALAYSAHGLRSARTRTEVVKHLAIIASTVIALRTHVTALPGEAQAWWGEAHTALLHTKEALLALKRKIFSERYADDIGKVAREIRALMAEGALA
jgi:hypothetical protein